MHSAPWPAPARLALWLLWMALVLTVACALLVFVCAHVVSIPDAQTAWTPVFPPIGAVAVSLLASIWALWHRHLVLTTGLTLVSAVLAAIMAFIVMFGVGWLTSESRTIVSPTWVTIISADVEVCFVLCVVTVIACAFALAGRRSRTAP